MGNRTSLEQMWSLDFMKRLPHRQHKDISSAYLNALQDWMSLHVKDFPFVEVFGDQADSGTETL